jgi:hypothetical protein
MKMESALFPATSAEFYQTTWQHSLNSLRRGNLKSNKRLMIRCCFYCSFDFAWKYRSFFIYAAYMASGVISVSRTCAVGTCRLHFRTEPLASSVLLTWFLTEMVSKLQLLSDPIYTSDLVPCDYHLPGKLKSVMCAPIVQELTES